MERLGLPLFHPFFLTKQTRADWAAKPRGANPGEFLISLFLPELDGAVETALLGAMGASGNRGGELSLIPERVEKYGRRLEGWLRLRHKPNRDKRVALIFYDYPPGEANLGTAAFLDVFQSLAAILARLKAQGFDTEAPERGGAAPGLHHPGPGQLGPMVPRPNPGKTCPGWTGPNTMNGPKALPRPGKWTRPGAAFPDRSWPTGTRRPCPD